MAISGNVPQHLVVGARSGFLAAMKGENFPWMRIAEVITMGAKTLELVDLGGAPMPIESKGGGPLQDYVERALTVRPRSWDITVQISHNAIQDDQTGTLLRKVQGAGENFQRHMNKIVFQALDAGDGTTYGKAYDGLSFFNGAHLNGPAGTYDNEFALALSLDNFQTNYNLAKAFADESGEPVDVNYDLIVVNQALERTAAQITGNGEDYSTANRAVNPYSGRLSYLVSPYMGSTAWAVVASNESSKPLAIVMREQPNLQDAWFDPNGADGGMYNFKFYARYNVAYGDPRLAFLGNS